MDSLSLTQNWKNCESSSKLHPQGNRADLAMAIEVESSLSSDNEFLNRAFADLIYLEAPDVVAKTLALMDKAQPRKSKSITSSTCGISRRDGLSTSESTTSSPCAPSKRKARATSRSTVAAETGKHHPARPNRANRTPRN